MFIYAAMIGLLMLNVLFYTFRKYNFISEKIHHVMKKK